MAEPFTGKKCVELCNVFLYSSNQIPLEKSIGLLGLHGPIPEVLDIPLAASGSAYQACGEMRIAHGLPVAPRAQGSARDSKL